MPVADRAALIASVAASEVRAVACLLAASRLAAPPGEPQRLREPISQAETRVLRYLPTN